MLFPAHLRESVQGILRVSVIIAHGGVHCKRRVPFCRSDATKAITDGVGALPSRKKQRYPLFMGETLAWLVLGLFIKSGIQKTNTLFH